jgi:hypothetical protein
MALASPSLLFRGGEQTIADRLNQAIRTHRLYQVHVKASLERTDTIVFQAISGQRY